MESKKDKKIIKIIISIIIILILLLLFVVAILRNISIQENKELDRIKSYTSIDNFKTVEEVAKYLDCNYIKQEKSKADNYSLDFYIKIKLLPYTENSSNEGFYNKLISYSAKVLKFDNFRIIDKENNIIIEVVCDKEKESIKNIFINGELDYFLRRDSKLQIDSYKKNEEKEFTIQSDIINKLIKNDWKIKESDIGTKESTFNSYDIYFDEGIEIRKIDNKVFNIVFTNKYQSNILNNIKVSSSRDSIINILGVPTFENESKKLIGYKGKDIYIFFDFNNLEVSAYRVEKNYDSKQFIEIVGKYLNKEYSAKQLIDLLKEEYKQYDECVLNKNKAELVYSLLGIKIQFGNNIQNGVFIFNNYTGQVMNNIDIKQILEEKLDLPDNIYLQNEDLVYNSEINRIEKIEYIQYVSSLQLDMINDNQKNDRFYTQRTYIDENTYNVKFLAKDMQYPNTELRVSINSDMWLNKYIFLYSIKNQGIYAYNIKDLKYYTLITGNNEEFKLIDYKDNKILYDDKYLKLE